MTSILDSIINAYSTTTLVPTTMAATTTGTASAAFSTSTSSFSSTEKTSLISNLFSIPKVDDSEAVWQKYLQDSVELIEGDPKAAQTIFLGDIHPEGWWQNAWRGSIIERYGSKKKDTLDVVLCEGVAAHKPIDPKYVDTFSITKKINCYGWDDTDACKSTDEIFSQMGKLTHVPSSKWSKSDFLTFEKLHEKLDQQTAQRNRCLVKTVKAFLRVVLKPGQKLFVIAGSNHLVTPKEESEAGYHILNYFKSNACVILPRQMEEIA